MTFNKRWILDLAHLTLSSDGAQCAVILCFVEPLRACHSRFPISETCFDYKSSSAFHVWLSSSSRCYCRQVQRRTSACGYIKLFDGPSRVVEAIQHIAEKLWNGIYAACIALLKTLMKWHERGLSKWIERRGVERRWSDLAFDKDSRLNHQDMVPYKRYRAPHCEHEWSQALTCLDAQHSIPQKR